MKNIIIVGGGGHAKVLASIINKCNNFKLIGYTDLIDKGDLLGGRYLGNDSNLEDILFSNNECNAIVGLGLVSISNTRKKLFENIRNLGFNIPTILSPNSIINHGVNIGTGSMVFDGTVINYGASIGNNVIINTNATIEHESIIKDNVHISPAATICGDVSVGENSIIGAGTVINQSVKICENVLIGSGSVVIKNITEPGVYVGSPTVKIK